MALTRRVLSGIQPTDKLHLGNYLGALKQWVALQDEFDGERFYCIVDLHAITAPYEPAELKQKIFDTALDFLAAGLDPGRSTVFVQSQVHEHAELMWLLNTITPIGALERMTQYKDKKKKHADYMHAGLLNYPILMAADILVYKASVVPVGEDQVQHLELTREIARKFNSTFGETFPEPQPKLTHGARIMSLTNPENKMSKSDAEKSYITLDAEPGVITSRLKKAVTDAGAGGSPGAQNLLTILKVVGSDRLPEFEKAAKAGTLRYGDLKSHLAERLSDYFAPFREKRRELASKPDDVWGILEAGADAAHTIAAETMKDVKEKMGFV